MSRAPVPDLREQGIIGAQRVTLCAPAGPPPSDQEGRSAEIPAGPDVDDGFVCADLDQLADGLDQLAVDVHRCAAWILLDQCDCPACAPLAMCVTVAGAPAGVTYGAEPWRSVADILASPGEDLTGGIAESWPCPRTGHRCSAPACAHSFTACHVMGWMYP